MRAEHLPRALEKLGARNGFHAQKRMCSVPNMLLARATPQVKRGYFGNRKFCRARVTNIPFWLYGGGSYAMIALISITV